MLRELFATESGGIYAAQKTFRQGSGDWEESRDAKLNRGGGILAVSQMVFRYSGRKHRYAYNEKRLGMWVFSSSYECTPWSMLIIIILSRAPDRSLIRSLRQLFRRETLKEPIVPLFLFRI